MGEKEGLERLYYELASESRIQILRHLETENIKMNELARRLDLTATEVFRQLQRLSGAQLIQKNQEGAYLLTAYGKLLMQLSSSVEFVFKHRQYFLTHEVSKLPREFINRLGELSETNLETDVIAIMNKIEKIVKEGESYEYFLGEKALSHMEPVMRAKSEAGVKFRFLFPKSLLPPNSDVWVERNIEGRGLSVVPAFLSLTEKEGIVCLPTTSGILDYLGFSGSDKTFLNWAKDLFLFYWERQNK
jgi:predicted transcriptional regulator